MDGEAVADLFAPVGPVSIKRMFGGLGIFHAGLMVAIVADGELFLKTDDDSLAAFREAGCRPFTYAAKGRSVVLSYWTVPDDACEGPEAFEPWGRRALAAALRAPRLHKVRRRPVREARRRPG